MEKFEIRQAVIEDVPLILKFVRDLAEYESLLDQVQATEASLEEWIFRQGKAEALIGECNGEPVAFALYFYNFSTFVGRAGIYLEDLFVSPQHRKKGYGKAFFTYLAKLCKQQDCGRLEWACLDWNQPSIDFYLSLGAVPMSDWTTYRLDQNAIGILASE